MRNLMKNVLVLVIASAILIGCNKGDSVEKMDVVNSLLSSDDVVLVSRVNVDLLLEKSGVEQDAMMSMFVESVFSEFEKSGINVKGTHFITAESNKIIENAIFYNVFEITNHEKFKAFVASDLGGVKEEFEGYSIAAKPYQMMRAVFNENFVIAVGIYEEFSIDEDKMIDVLKDMVSRVNAKEKTEVPAELASFLESTEGDLATHFSYDGFLKLGKEAGQIALDDMPNDVVELVKDIRIEGIVNFNDGEIVAEIKTLGNKSKLEELNFYKKEGVADDFSNFIADGKPAALFAMNIDFSKLKSILEKLQAGNEILDGIEMSGASFSTFEEGLTGELVLSLISTPENPFEIPELAVSFGTKNDLIKDLLIAQGGIDEGDYVNFMNRAFVIPMENKLVIVSNDVLREKVLVDGKIGEYTGDVDLLTSGPAFIEINFEEFDAKSLESLGEGKSDVILKEISSLRIFGKDEKTGKAVITLKNTEGNSLKVLIQALKKAEMGNLNI